MNPTEREKLRNSEFFESAIVERSAGRGIWAGSLSAEFSRAEIVYWAMIGVQIEYLSRDYVRDLFSRCSGPIVSACEVLKERGQFPFPLPKDWPAPPVALSKAGISIGNDDSPDWLKRTDTQPQLWKTFQYLMLLVSENLLAEETHAFVNGIGWTQATEWNALREGSHLDQYSVPSPSHTVESIQLGFAQVTRHWKDESLLLNELFQRNPPHVELFRETEIPRRVSEVDWETARRFVDACFYISRHRYNLADSEILDRYFSYAGSLLQQTKDGSAGWLDLRREAFDDFRSLVARGEATTVTLDIPRLWALFAQIEVPVQSGVPEQRSFELGTQRRIILKANEQSEEDKDDEKQQEHS